ncbi:putative calcium-binding protein CML30 [Hibiscus syriacus]|uniref:Calcium-binding protein CML30 n=1 Tax=Hibiscus syriacus TaxID=106335 RepID=A0A6A3BWY0_HIBSY|nr:probable calcium-binding protein CML46 [Hibiscus syriacus]KAE8721226.1 putative calcium-binding protein CML30 [Hibiscus syriacus]
MEASSTNSNYTLIPFIDISMILLFLSLTCYDSFKSFLLTYWSFHQSKHGSSKASPDLQKTQNFECSTEEAPFHKKEDCVTVCGKDVEKLMGNLGFFCSRESEELNESFGSDELSRLFEEEPSFEELKEAFDVFDVNKDGFIDAQKLQRVLCILGLKEGLKIENCNKMINNFDVNRDGRIDFQEFVKLMENNFF